MRYDYLALAGLAAIAGIDAALVLTGRTDTCKFETFCVQPQPPDRLQPADTLVSCKYVYSLDMGKNRGVVLPPLGEFVPPVVFSLPAVQHN